MNFVRVFAKRATRLSSLVRRLPIIPLIGVSAFATQMPATAEESVHMHEMVSQYYGQILETSNDLKTTACTTANAPPSPIRAALLNVPQEIKMKYYGCGSPLPSGIQGLTVLDLGSGSGQDCYIAAQLVGESGNVIGIDMTDEQLNVANKYVEEFCTQKLGYKQPNLQFIKGYIEMLDTYIDKQSIDIVISNCVINLSPRKDQVLNGVWNVLKEGGEFYFSDVYCDRRLSAEIRKHPTLVGECLGGALYMEDFRRICNEIGFKDPRILSVSEISVTNKELKELVGNARFYSITYRLFKCEQIEDKCEDYGQIAVYNGSIPGYPHFYDLDDHHRFYTNKPMLVCGNTANMVGGYSWLSRYFQVVGDTNGEHFGLFDCSSTVKDRVSSGSSVGGSCCV